MASFTVLILVTSTVSAAGLGKCASFMHVKEIKAADGNEKQMEIDIEAATKEFDKFDAACNGLKVSSINELKVALENFKADASATALIAARVRKSITDTYDSLVSADRAMLREGSSAGQAVPPGTSTRPPFSLETAMACIGEIRADAPEVKDYLAQLNAREERLKNCTPPVPADTGSSCSWTHDARRCGIGGCVQARNGAWCRRVN